MIFLSHNSKDKNLVEPIYLELKQEFPEDNIFFDDESIQPGASIIGKMSEGLEKNHLFFLFWSKDASKSKMVEREWQTGLRKTINEGTKLVVIVLDRTPLPEILRDYKYLDYSDGYDSIMDAILKIILGKNPYIPKHESVENFNYMIKDYKNEYEWEIKIEAIYNVEYGVIYFVASDNLNNISLSFDDTSGFAVTSNGSIIDNQQLALFGISKIHNFIAPGEPDTIVVKLKNKNIPTKFYIGMKTLKIMKTMYKLSSFKSVT